MLIERSATRPSFGVPWKSPLPTWRALAVTVFVTPWKVRSPVTSQPFSLPLIFLLSKTISGNSLTLKKWRLRGCFSRSGTFVSTESASTTIRTEDLAGSASTITWLLSEMRSKRPQASEMLTCFVWKTTNECVPSTSQVSARAGTGRAACVGADAKRPAREATDIEQRTSFMGDPWYWGRARAEGAALLRASCRSERGGCKPAGSLGPASRTGRLREHQVKASSRVASEEAYPRSCATTAFSCSSSATLAPSL